MRIVPLCYNPFLSEDEIYQHECSDRIWVSRHTFERWMMAEDVGNVVIVRLEHITACMYGPHAGPSNVIYAPMWMCDALRVSTDPPMEHDDDDEDEDSDEDKDIDDDLIVPERIHPPMCTFIKVQPHTSDHLPSCVGGHGDAMPEDTLSRAFEEYTCIHQGQTLMLHLPHGTRMFVTIVEAHPSEGPLCIRNTEIAMDLLPPLDLPPTPDAPPAEAPPTETTTEAPPTETREERREKILKAALARLK